MPSLMPTTEESLQVLTAKVESLKAQVQRLESHGLPAAIADHEKRFTMWGTFFGVLAIAVLTIVRCA
ncbi:MAG: hypothetical protein AAGA75_11730 [Cyanobacteria bacterium P01_E01_bin.6]